MAASICSLVNQLSTITQSLQASKRYSLYPIEDEEMFSYYNRHVATVWTNVEMDFSRDKEDFEQLSPNCQHIVSMILAFFSSADGVILNNLAFRFILEAKTLEEKCFYIVQQFMELIHSEGYSLAINSMISDPDQKKLFFEAADNSPSIIRKNAFMEKYLYSDLEKPYRLAAFACSEGIFFISAFLIVFWFRSQNRLANFIFLNEQVSKDETLHRDFACYRYRQEKKETPVDLSAKTAEIVSEAVAIEIDFINELLIEDEADLTKEQARAYIYRLGNSLLLAMGESALFPEREIPKWMEDLSMQQKSNLYEVRGGNYRSRDNQKAEKLVYQGDEEDF